MCFKLLAPKFPQLLREKIRLQAFLGVLNKLSESFSSIYFSIESIE